MSLRKSEYIDRLVDKKIDEYLSIFGAVSINKIIVGGLAFGINSGAYVAEIVRSGIMSIDQGQTEAGLVLGIALCGRWWQKKEIPTALWLPLIGIVGGFLFSIIWEAQSRYVFPYYVFLILFVPMGLYETGRAISRLPKHRRKTTEQNQTQEESLREIA